MHVNLSYPESGSLVTEKEKDIDMQNICKWKLNLSGVSVLSHVLVVLESILRVSV